MAFKQVADLDADRTTSIGGADRKTGKKNPTQVEGYYLGAKKVTSPKSKTGFAQLHIFQTSAGNLGVWGKTDMDRKLANATPGAMTRVSFDRMLPTPNGEMYKYKVEIDEDNAVEVPGLGASTNSSADSGNGFDQTEEEPEYGQEDAEDDEDEKQEQALAALQRKAKINALLGKNKR